MCKVGIESIVSKQERAVLAHKTSWFPVVLRAPQLMQLNHFLEHSLSSESNSENTYTHKNRPFYKQKKSLRK